MLGSSFLALGSLGVGWFPLAFEPLRWQFLHYLQTQTLGLALSRALVIVGAALLLQAWLIVGVDTLHEQSITEKQMLKTLLCWIAPLMFAAPLFSRDVYAYFMQGHLQIEGNDPYQSGVALTGGWFTSGVDPMWAESKTPYGPAFLMIERVVAQLCGNSAFLSAFIFRLIGALSVFVLAKSIGALARRHGINPASAMWLGVLNPLVLMHFIAGSHNDSLMVALVALGFVFAVDGKFVKSVLLVTLAVAIKPVALVTLPFLGIQATNGQPLRKRIFSFGFTLVIAAGTMLALSLIAKVDPLGWISALATPGSVRSWLSPVTALGITVGTLFSHIGFGDQMSTTIAIMRGLGFATLLGTVGYLVLLPRGRSATRGAAFALAAIVLCGPVVQPWYLLWTIPLLAATGLNTAWLRVIIISICGFTIHGVANASATADTFLEFSDGLAMVIAAITLAIAIFASPRERALIIGDRNIKPLMPTSMAEQQLADRQKIRS